MLENFLLVGGASAYAPGLVRALLQDADRHDLKLVRLYDIAEKRLEIVERLCSKMAEASDASIDIEATTDQIEAVRDIDVLLNSSRPGGFEGRTVDERLPLEFEIPGQETVGPGGFFFALRSIPAALDLADDVAEHSPDAVWLNYTNPTNIVGQALADRTDLNIVALCDQSDEDILAIADALGYPDDVDYEFDCSGLNHATWYRDIRLNGDPVDDRIFEADPPEHFDEEHKIRFRHSAEMARPHDGRLWPNSYLPYYEVPGQFVDLARRVGVRTEAILENLEDYYDHFREEAERDEPRLTHYRGSSGFGDMAADTVAALSSEPPHRLVVNVVNAGLIEEFDDATVVEAFAALGADGLERGDTPPVPEFARPLLEQLETYQRLTAEAAVSGDADQLRRALAANPLVDDDETADRMLERAATAYGEMLPQL